MTHPTQPTSKIHKWVLLGVLTAAVILVAILSICLGSVLLSPKTVFIQLLGSSKTDLVLQQIILDFRIPRILTAMLAGAALATAGLLMQTLFKNPLADPFVLGVNSGASLGVAIVVLAIAPVGIQLAEQLDASGQLLIILASSSGAALTLFAVLLLSYKTDMVSLLIIGLMISYVVGALVSILISLSMAERLQSFLSWSFGTYSSVSWDYLPTFAPVILGTLGVGIFLVKPASNFNCDDWYPKNRVASANAMMTSIRCLNTALSQKSINAFINYDFSLSQSLSSWYEERT